MEEETPPWSVSWLWPLAAGLRALGSVQLAVALIAVCIAVLVWATMIESRYGAAAARSAIYGTRGSLRSTSCWPSTCFSPCWSGFPGGGGRPDSC